MELSHQKELIDDVYPILKLLFKFNQDHIQKDYSIQNVLKKKIIWAFQDMILKSFDDFDTLYSNSKSMLKDAKNNLVGRETEDVQ